MISKNKVRFSVSLDKRVFQVLEAMAKEAHITKSAMIEAGVMQIASNFMKNAAAVIDSDKKAN